MDKKSHSFRTNLDEAGNEIILPKICLTGPFLNIFYTQEPLLTCHVFKQKGFPFFHITNQFMTVLDTIDLFEIFNIIVKRFTYICSVTVPPHY